MNANDCTGDATPYNSSDFKPYLVDGVFVWIHDQFFNQTRVVQKPFQKIVKIMENDVCTNVWIELV
jgi:hypothetical protein